MILRVRMIEASADYGCLGVWLGGSSWDNGGWETWFGEGI
jgi:hypothetical protein